MQIHVIWYCVLIFHDRTNIVKCYELWFAPIHTTPLKRTLHPKMDGLKTSVLLGWPMFRGYISFREGILYIIFITYTIICVMKNFHSYYQSRDKPFIFEISHAQIFFTFYWHIHIQLWYHIIILCFFCTQATEKHWSKLSFSTPPQPFEECRDAKEETPLGCAASRGHEENLGEQVFVAFLVRRKMFSCFFGVRIVFFKKNMAPSWNQPSLWKWVVERWVSCFKPRPIFRDELTVFL